ncbi:MAG: 30S ribosomal protein S8 [Planctomycetes bacterium]|nr:30S ribosomal protein S8 [Planctomycetota bacterium]MCK5473296.1 30S ribosomal protein S8 [Planctomycetota bacterium]
MSLSDPIADMLTRIRNAVRISRPSVEVKASNVCEGIAAVLKQEGYIADFDRIDDNKQGIIKIELKYAPDGRAVITEIARVSKPSRRIYSPVDELPRVLAGYGVAIVSTSKGVISDKVCRELKVGGEILCMVS